MKPPNLKDVVMPCCCGNCNFWDDRIQFCIIYNYDTAFDQICKTWDRIEYGN